MAVPPLIVEEPPERTVGRRYRPLYVVVAVTTMVLGAMGGRVAQLQLLEGSRNRELAASNRIRLEPRAAERGALLDAKGRLLAGSRLAPSVFLWPVAQPPARWAEILPRLAEVLDIPEAKMRQRLEQVGYRSPVLVRIVRGLDANRATVAAELSAQFEGVETEIERVRFYPQGELARAVLGSVGPLPSEEVMGSGLPRDEVVGQSGLEAALDDRLRGESGGQQVELDAQLQRSRILAQKNPQSGFDVQLTLNLDVQQAAETALGKAVGSVVAIDPSDGAVVALVSRPRREASHPARPVLNRALQGDRPGPLLYLSLVLAALETNRLDPQSPLQLNPRDRLGGSSLASWRTSPAPVILAKALADPATPQEAILQATFFEHLAAQLDLPTLFSWWQQLGFGEKTGLELERDEQGSTDLVALQQSLALQSRWYPGSLVATAVGQGNLRVSPLQLARLLAVVANDGLRVQPHLVQASGARARRERLPLSPTTIAAVRASLPQRPLVLPAAIGPTPPPQSPPQSMLPPSAAIPARPVPQMVGLEGVDRAINGRSRAWYGAYGPAEDPRLVVVVAIEGGGRQDLAQAAAVARATINAYLQ